MNKIKKIFSIENRTKHFVATLAVLLAASVFVFVVMILGNQVLQQKNKKEAVAKIDYFENLDLQAKSVMVYDVINNREIFSKNPDEPLPLASLTKIITAVVASRNLENNQQIQITANDLTAEGDSGLIVGDIWKVGDLRDFTLITSSNDGAMALASQTEKQKGVEDTKEDEQKFVREMNQAAVGIGLSNSTFFNEHGLDRGNIAGAYGSARDMTELFEYVLKNYPEILEATKYQNMEISSTEKNYNAENTNVYANKIPNLVASKTGYTDLAGGNLVVAFDAGINRPIIISVLGSTQEGRFTDTLKLVEATIKNLNN